MEKLDENYNLIETAIYVYNIFALIFLAVQIYSTIARWI